MGRHESMVASYISQDDSGAGHDAHLSIFLTAALNLLSFCFYFCGLISTSVLFGRRDGAISAYHAWIDLLFQATSQQVWSLSLL